MTLRKLWLVLILLVPVLVQAGQKLDAPGVVSELTNRGDAVTAAYTPANGLDTMDAFSSLYFDVFEATGLEVAVGIKDPGLKTRVESMFGEVVGLAGQGATKAKLMAAWQQLRSALTEDVQALFAQEDTSFTSLALQAFLILLREGFEAMLVVMALAAWIRRSNAGEGMSALYGGIALALVASMLTAYGIKILFEVSGAGQDALEGITMLVASAVLLYVSHWLLAKRQADKWQAYIRNKVDRALSAGQLWALGFAVFLAVYREGAETILFYYALAGQTEQTATPLVLGGGLAMLALVAAYLMMRTASLRVPLPVFFTATAALLFYLAFDFAGTGILELQEAGWVSNTPLQGIPRITWLGIYPTLETLMAQGVVLMPLGLTAIWLWRQRRIPASA